MKLKNLKQGKKETKKQQPKPQVEQPTKVQDDEELRDDALIDIKQDLKKKEDIKPKVNKRIEASKLEQQEIDTSKILVQKKQQVKKPPEKWVVNVQDVKKLLQKDYEHVDHDFESLTDTKLNEELKQKKEKQKEQQKNENVGGFKFAPLSHTDPLQNKKIDTLTLGKPKTETSSIAFSPAPALNFTNSKLGNGNMNVAPIEKPQLYDDDIEKKMQQRLAETKKAQQETKAAEKGKGWFRPTAPKEVPKQAPKIEFKNTPLTFTNSALSNQGQQQQFKGFQPIQKSKQEQIYEKKQQEFKFTNKKQAEQRRKKREEQLKLQPGKVQAVEKA